MTHSWLLLFRLPIKSPKVGIILMGDCTNTRQYLIHSLDKAVGVSFEMKEWQPAQTKKKEEKKTHNVNQRCLIWPENRDPCLPNPEKRVEELVRIPDRYPKQADGSKLRPCYGRLNGSLWQSGRRRTSRRVGAEGWRPQGSDWDDAIKSKGGAISSTGSQSDQTSDTSVFWSS